MSLNANGGLITQRAMDRTPTPTQPDLLTNDWRHGLTVEGCEECGSRGALCETCERELVDSVSLG